MHACMHAQLSVRGSTAVVVGSVSHPVCPWLITAAFHGLRADNSRGPTADSWFLPSLCACQSSFWRSLQQYITILQAEHFMSSSCFLIVSAAAGVRHQSHERAQGQPGAGCESAAWGEAMQGMSWRTQRGATTSSRRQEWWSKK